MRCPLVAVVRVLILVLSVSTSFVVPAVQAQDATPGSTPGTVSAQLDLPAMVLVPADLDEPGFGMGRSEFQRVEDQAEYVASLTAVPLAEVLEPLRAAGFVRRYNLALEQRVPDGAATPEGIPDPVGVRIETSITEYTSADGAAAGFALLERQFETQAEAEDLPLTIAIGDEAELTHSSSTTADTNLPYQNLNLTFRLDNLVADVILQDFSNQELAGADAEALAQKLQARIEEVLANGGPGLSSQVIRLEGEPAPDGYIARDGTPIPSYLETPESLALLARSFGTATDVYSLEQALGASPYLVARLYRFPSEDDAATWLADQPGPTLASPDSGYVDVADVTGVDALGDESRIFAYGFPLDDTTTARGYAVFVRVGEIVARVQVDSLPEAPRDAVIQLAEAQVDCLVAGSCPASLPVPAALVAADATPAASPAATPAG